MKFIMTAATGIGLLIAIYLFVTNSDKTVGIINAIGSNATNGIKTLQAR